MKHRAFLFLQGPPGPLFRLLGEEMSRQGIEVHRINLSGGDKLDWPEGTVHTRARLALQNLRLELHQLGLRPDDL